MPLPKVIVNPYPVLPAADEADRAARRPLGRNARLYHEVVQEMTDIVKAADELGAWAVSTIEHHMHSEGYEVSPNPGVLNAYWASQVKQARVGTIGYVVGTGDPIRVAEEMTVVDHLTRGKYFAGFARGYQNRWTSIMGQYTNTQATVSDGGEDDQRNREIFEERVDQILACWTQETVNFDGKYYKAPYPYDSGVTNFPAREVAERMGAAGEIDENGAVRRVSVVPAPYQKPHPPVFTAVSASMESNEFCSERGITPVYFSSLQGITDMAHHYVAHGAKHGRRWQLGERQCIVRWPQLRATRLRLDASWLSRTKSSIATSTVPSFRPWSRARRTWWTASSKPDCSPSARWTNRSPTGNTRWRRCQRNICASSGTTRRRRSRA